MLFNSYIFILLFLPCTLIGYFVLNHFGKHTAAQIFLIGMSLWFYGYFNPKYLLIIIGSIAVNYGFSLLLQQNERPISQRKFYLVMGLILDVGCLFTFKYYDFFVGSINIAFKENFTLLHLALPLGISFYTFQQISYLVDSYRGKTKEYTFLEYMLFVVFFPQLIAGPIVQHSEMIPQFREEERWHLNQKNLALGLYIFSLGLFKKVLIADTFGKVVANGFKNVDTLTTLAAIVVSVSYTLQLYFDFSGYCDMAIGVGNMLNIDLPANFNSPYKALSIGDFWKRWHMSLTRFLREYVYFPLGGSKKGCWRTYLNTMIVFLISGIWHGANWTFIVWGVLHGVFNCISRFIKPVWDRVWKPIRWFVTFSIVNALWVIFRADSLQQAWIFLQRMFGRNDFTLDRGYELYFKLKEFNFIEGRLPFLKNLSDSVYWLYAIIFFGLAFGIIFFGKNSKEIRFKPTVARALLTVVLMVWSILSLSGVSEFLYFDF